MPAHMLSDTDKARVRAHLNYPALAQGPGIMAGVVIPVPVLLSVEFAMNNILDDYSLQQIVKYLDILDDIETKMVAAEDRLQALKADVVTLNNNELLDLEGHYSRWQQKLSNALSIPVNPVAPAGGARGLNMRLAQ